MKLDLIKDIDMVFETDRALHDALKTNAKTWNKIKKRSGLREKTVVARIKHFFYLLEDVSTNEAEDSGIDRRAAKRLYTDKYQQAVKDGLYADYLEQLPN
jgi:hypothetical protein